MPATKQLPDDVWTALEQTADELRALEAHAGRVRYDLDRLMVRAMRDGHQVEAIAWAAHVSRQTVYAARRSVKCGGDGECTDPLCLKHGLTVAEIKRADEIRSGLPSGHD